jgi:excisionase family DNA binding protein
VILFDRDTALDVIDAFRLLEGRLRSVGRQLSEGSIEIISAAERSARVHSGQPSPEPDGRPDNQVVAALLALEDVNHVLHCSPSTTRRLIAAGELVAVRIGASVRVRPADLQAYIDGLPATKQSA